MGVSWTIRLTGAEEAEDEADMVLSLLEASDGLRVIDEDDREPDETNLTVAI